ncbi:MAG: NAD(P)-binding protein [Halioglobus sp.]
MDKFGPASDAWGDEVPAARRAQHKVLVIGGGMSGVLAAYRLQEAGIPFVVIKEERLGGGTWFNRYPGVRVDVGNHLYCYSFEAAHHWSTVFTQQKELRQYFEDVVNHHRLRPAFSFQHRNFTAATFDETQQLWTVDTVDKDGVSERYRSIP